ncbi:MAG: MFS transporter [Candidatus Izemoplasmataceae bacterium]
MNFRLLKDKNYIVFMIGKVISLLGSNIQQFALSLYVFALTGSATLFASLIAISILPRIIFSPFAGVMGDWFDRKKMIIILDFTNAILLGFFALIFMSQGRLDLWLIYVLVIVLEIVEIFYGASSSAIVPSIVSKEDIVDAKSLQSFIFSIAQLVSPLIAATLYGLLGLLVVLVFNALSFLIGAIMELFLTIPAYHKKPDKVNVRAFFKDIKEGLILIKSDAFIFTTIILATGVNFLISPFYSVGFIVLIKRTLEGTDFMLGLFHSTLGLSMLVGPVLVSTVFKKYAIKKVFVNSFIVISIFILFVAIIPIPFVLNQFNGIYVPLTLLLILGFVIGVFTSVINVTIGAIIAQTIPLNMMGRTSATLQLLVTVFIPIGQMTFGLMYDTLMPSYVIMISGSLMLILVLLLRKPLLKDSPSKKDLEKETLLYEH